MDFGESTDRSIPEIWFEPADPRRFAVLLGRVLLALGMGTLGLWLAAVIVLTGRIERDERFEDERLALTVAAAPTDSRSDLVAGSGRSALVVTPDAGDGVRPGVEVLAPGRPPDGDTLAWLRAVAGRRNGVSTAQFDSVAPDGTRWWHTTTAIDNGSYLVLQRPRADAMATADALLLWSGALGVALASGLGLVWLVLRRHLERSTTQLLEAVEDLRILGRLREGVRRRLVEMPTRPIELRRLATALVEIEVDVGRTFAQVDSLLRAAAVLGSSLDPEVVLATSLDRLEELLDADRSAILRYDHRLNNFEVVATRGHSATYLAAMSAASVDPWSPSIQAIRRRVPVQISDTETGFTRGELRERARANGYRSVLAVPLPPVLSHPTVLVLHKGAPYTYSYDEIDLSISFASMAAAALRNAELFARTDQDLGRQSSRLTAIIESVDEGLLVESVDGTVIYANSAMRALAGCGTPAAGTTSDAFLASVLAGSDRAGEAVGRIAGLDGEDQGCDVEVGGNGAEGGEGGARTYRVRRFTVTDNADDTIGRGLVWTDVTADRALEEMKAGLLATVSHEFRTPLALIKGYATTLLADDVEWRPEDRDDFLRLVVSEADRLADLVQRLLDLRRIDAGMVDLQTVPVELDAVVARALDGVGADSSRVEVSPLPHLVLDVDETRIATALRNLVENACRYSPADAPVSVSASIGPGGPDGPLLRIEVADRGPGIPAELEDAIFEVFVRGDHDHPTAVGEGGTGLGLAIARGFVEAHGGRLGVAPRPGGGSVFHLVLPAPPVQETPADGPAGVESLTGVGP